MARRPSRSPTASAVTWRDGVHLTGTPIWCDARRRRDVCFVSSADRVGAAGHGQLIGTATTLALIGARGHGHLAAPLRRPFTLGQLRLELIPSGRGLGAAALHVDAGVRTILYAGAVRTTDGREPAEVRAADAAVVAAPVGEPHHVFAPRAEVEARLVAWVRAHVDAGRAPVLVVDATIDALEIATHLAAAGLAIAASRPVRDAALRVASVPGGDAQLPAIRAPGREPCVMIRLDSDRGKPSDAPHALVSARAIDAVQGYDTRFAWPFVAGREQLLAWIEQTRAKDIFVTGACAESIAAALGPRARVLGPPLQMTLRLSR